MTEITLDNWREVDTSDYDGRRTVERIIAQSAGLTVYHEPDNPAFTDEREWEDSYIVMENPYRCYAVPEYFTDANFALALFDNIRGIRLIMDQVLPGEWRVGYQYNGWRYLPGSGSFYPKAEAISRAWLYFITTLDIPTSP